MARKQDTKAARERKQKIFVAVAGVLFLGLMALQGPKLLKQLKGSEPAATPATSSAPSSATPAGTPAAQDAGAVPQPAVPVSAPRNATAKLAGVVIVRELPAKPGTGQLRSFTRFDQKDPFVQQVDPDRLPTPAEVAAHGGGSAPAQQPAGGSSGAAAGGQAQGGTTPPNGAGSGSQAGAGGTAGTPPLPVSVPAPTMAMLRVNGRLQTVALKHRFPSSDKAFVLRALQPGSAVIAVAGGSFGAGGNKLTLKLGEPVTLVNTATGARYVLRLVYVGADAKQVTGFTAK